jgi:uncharacterized protein YdeI (YjbR/CyaY-like superfamily)
MSAPPSEETMGTRDPRVDAYIAGSADFARPVLTFLRDVVHGACPDVEETMKWNFPHFLHHGMMCGMAAFKEHCTLGFWKGSLVVPADARGGEAAMGQLGRITGCADLPTKKVLTGYIKTAMRLNEEGVRAPGRAKPKVPRAEAEVPEDLAGALRKNRKARASFEGFSPSQRREYVEWITEAKREETRARRVETAVEWLAEGKPRNWKYTK